MENEKTNADAVEAFFSGIEADSSIIREVKVQSGSLKVTVDLGPIIIGGVKLYGMDVLDWCDSIDAHYNRVLNDVCKAFGDLSNKGQDIFVGDTGFLGRDKSVLYQTTIELEPKKRLRKTSRLPKAYGDSGLIKSLQTLYDEGCWSANGKKHKDYLHGCGEGHFCGTMA